MQHTLAEAASSPSEPLSSVLSRPLGHQMVFAPALEPRASIFIPEARSVLSMGFSPDCTILYRAILRCSAPSGASKGSKKLTVKPSGTGISGTSSGTAIYYADRTQTKTYFYV